MKYNVIVSDPPWPAKDELKMSATKRGASSQYKVLDIQAIKDLPVKDLSEDAAVLALWVPSWLLQEGLDVMKAWGFRQTQTHVWVKVKKSPLDKIKKDLFKILKSKDDLKTKLVSAFDLTDRFDLSDVLSCYLGRLFRQTHEICLLGVRGKIYKQLEDKAQRSVHFGYNGKHSAKPENLQDMLDKMFPKATRLEMFARRSRAGWTCVGNECPSTMDEDIRDSLTRLKELP